MYKHLIAGLTIVVTLAAVTLAACKSPRVADNNGGASSEASSADKEDNADADKTEKASGESAEGTQALPETADEPGLRIATFAGGCFWCMEPPFDKTDGVERTISGYTGGKEEAPTYREVASGQTSHAEAVRVYYDPDKVSYDELVNVFWRNINPTQNDGQFVDHGTQYRTAIFYHDAEQKAVAEKSRDELAESSRFDKPIVTEVVAAGTFWKAEEYHQDFYKKDPVRYKSYRSGSGRDEYIESIWGDE